MLLGALLVEVYIPSATSLKEKRQVVKSVLQKVRNRFNVSIVEIDNEGLWRRATIAVALAGDSQEHMQRQLQLVLNFMDQEPRWEITYTRTEWR